MRQNTLQPAVDTPSLRRDDDDHQMKRALRITLLTLAHAVLIVLILGLLLANWMPAIYTSDWFKQMFPPPAATPAGG